MVHGRSVHDAISSLKRILESGDVVPGGGAVEVALAMYLDSFARMMGSREQMAIAEFAQAMLVIPRTLAVNGALDAPDLVAKLCALHDAAQKSPDKKMYSRYCLCLSFFSMMLFFALVPPFIIILLLFVCHYFYC